MVQLIKEKQLKKTEGKLRDMTPAERQGFEGLNADFGAQMYESDNGLVIVGASDEEFVVELYNDEGDPIAFMSYEMPESALEVAQGIADYLDVDMIDLNKVAKKFNMKSW